MKNIDEKAKIISQDLTKERLDKLKELLPELFSSDGNLNIQNLYDLANKYSHAKKEKYEFNWAGKLECQKLALEPTKSCLLPNFDKSINFDKTGNIIIEGDNLEVLKTLYLPYFEKIKCIYIDPPYNTGNDFIYDDKRQEGKKAYWQRNGITCDGIKLETNPEATGRKHSLWCSFIYPRLMLARNLLSKDGVIFVSIDDNEVHNLRKMMDEVFGEENFFADMVVIRSEGGGLSKKVIKGHDSLLIYAKDNSIFEGIYKPKDIRGKIVEKNGQKYWLEEDWLRKEFGKYGTCLYEELEKLKGVEKKIEIDNGIKDGIYQLIKKGDKHIVGRFRQIDQDGSKFYSITKHLNKNGIKDLSEINLNNFFDFPKPLSLVEELIRGATFFVSNNTILDFFAGSGTTAHATLKLNAFDKIKYAQENHPKLEKGEISKEDYLQGLDEAGSRKFILTQLPEYTDEKSEAFKAGYKTISAICIERVKRAGQKIVEEIKAEKTLNDEAKEQIIASLDIGFKTYQLKDTNIDKAYYEMENPEILEEYLKNSQQLKLFGDEKTNLLYEIAIKNGFDLSVNFVRIDAIKDNEVYQVNAGNKESALICVDEEIKLDSINQITQETSKNNRSWHFFCFDNALSITVKTNLKSKVRAVVI